MTNSGNKSWKIVYHPKVRKDLQLLNDPHLERVKTSITQKLHIDPIEWAIPLRKTLSGSYKIRVGDYRIVFQIDEPNKLVSILAIAHRSKVYTTASKRI